MFSYCTVTLCPHIGQHGFLLMYCMMLLYTFNLLETFFVICSIDSLLNVVYIPISHGLGCIYISLITYSIYYVYC